MDFFRDFWPHLAAVVDIIVALVASAHAVLYKRDTRATIAWVGLIWLAPLVGSACYVLLGINRIPRKARLRRGRAVHRMETPDVRPVTPSLASALGEGYGSLQPFVQLMSSVSKRPLLAGNTVDALAGGDAAYASMIEAIDGAERSVSLSTYIFDDDRAGNLFVRALFRAVQRKVEVRVIVDDMGARYSLPRITGTLQGLGIPVATFIPPLIPWRFQHTNLRTHRKIMVVDGRTGFAGGMNIREGNCASLDPDSPIEDLHFKVRGPVVGQMQEVFAEDWAFCTDEILNGPAWFPSLEPKGAALVRGIGHGPDEYHESLRFMFLGAIAAARESVVVVTPYFLPDLSLITELCVAAMRGVTVDIVLPRRNNVRLVEWACQSLLWQVVEPGCRVWLTPPPFDHSKFMIVDRRAAVVGSANWDARSLRLNFEFSLECYDPALAQTLSDLAHRKIQSARRVTIDELDGRSLPIRLRDGLARLCSPYL